GQRPDGGRESPESAADPRRSPDPPAGRARNDRVGAQLDLVSLGATRRRRRGAAGGDPDRTRGAATDGRGPAAAAVYPDGVHRSAAALSPGVVDDAAGAGRRDDWRLSLPGRDVLPPQPVPHSARHAFFSRSRGVRPDPVGGPTRGWSCPACLSPLWRGAAPVP